MGGANSGSTSGKGAVESAATLLVARDGGDVGRLIAGPDATEVLVVSGNRTVRSIVSDWRASHGSLPAAFGLITFAEFDRSAADPEATAAGGPTRRSLPGHDIRLTAMSDPADLQRLGTAVMLYLDDWADTDLETVVYVDALSPFVDASDVESTFQLLHLLTQTITQRDARLIVRADPSTLDEQTLNTLRPLFDTVVDPTAEPASGQLDVDTVHELLSNPRRQFVLHTLFEEGGVALDRLTTRLACWENETRDPTDAECSRAYAALASIHVPQLEEAGVVVFDRTAERVALSESARDADRLRDHLDVDSDSDRP
jgi:hypothetical protein